MNIAILGYDVEGRTSYEYFVAQGGHEITICDQNPAIEVPAGVASVLGDSYLDDLDRFDVLVRTAGLPPELILDRNPNVADKITSLINEFMRVSPTSNIIGVTGTKGKGTTSTLIHLMLQAAGKHVWLGGNIGLPPLEFLSELTAESWIVLELSSFQLSDLRISPHIGVCLMVVPEHLNWHPDINGYTHAKSLLFAQQKPDDIAIYLAGNELSKLIAAAGDGQKLPYFAPPGAAVQDDAIVIDGQTICRVDELKLLGKHNWQNACAAVTVAWQVTQDVSALRSVLITFTGLPHRLELVRELRGVKYYDDSFGTAPETATVALEAFNQPTIVILGGRTKDIPFDELAKTIAAVGHVKHVITIGETGSEIASLLRAQGYEHITEGGHNMTEIVSKAQQLATAGDVVLLSPACTSFDMFANYKDRGEQFSRAVQALV